MVNTDKILEVAEVVKRTEAMLSDMLGSKAVLHIEFAGKDKVASVDFVNNLLIQIKEQVDKMRFLDRRLTPEFIIQTVCDLRSVDVSECLGELRYRNVVLARNICWYFLRNLLALNHSQVGKLFGKSHATVIHGLKALRNDMQQSVQLRADIEFIRQTIKHQTNENNTKTN